VISRVGRVGRTRAAVEPGLSRLEQKRRRVTWRRRCASVEIPTVKQQRSVLTPIKDTSRCQLLDSDC
jgi:hypothetical protein